MHSYLQFVENLKMPNIESQTCKRILVEGFFLALKKMKFNLRYQRNYKSGITIQFSQIVQ